MTYPNDIRSVCYISNLPKRPNVEIGEYTYYSDNKKLPEKFYDNIEHIHQWKKMFLLFIFLSINNFQSLL